MISYAHYLNATGRLSCLLESALLTGVHNTERMKLSLGTGIDVYLAFQLHVDVNVLVPVVTKTKAARLQSSQTPSSSCVTLIMDPYPPSNQSKFPIWPSLQFNLCPRASQTTRPVCQNRLEKARARTAAVGFLRPRLRSLRISGFFPAIATYTRTRTALSASNI